MKAKFAKSTVTLGLVIIMLLLPVLAHAASWHSPNGSYWWSVSSSFCQKGAEITIATIFQPPPWEGKTRKFSAWEYTGKATPDPQLVLGDLSPLLGASLGRVAVDGTAKRKPLTWSNNGNDYTTHYYGIKNLLWTGGPIPVGTTVAIRIEPAAQQQYFIAQVTDCAL